MVELSNEPKDQYQHLIEEKGPPLSGVNIDIESFTEIQAIGQKPYLIHRPYRILKTSLH
jgi:hypothetical protein